MTQKVLLTGATGVLGRRVTRQLLEAGHSVTAVARGPEKARQVSDAGAVPAEVDLFDADDVLRAVAGHDAICHIATHIPTGLDAVLPWVWRTNDRLRRDSSRLLADAAIRAGVERYVGESLTFPYVDSADRWIDESFARTYFSGNQTTVDAEAAAHSLTAAGGVGVSLRFAMLHASDSANLVTFKRLASRGISPLFGEPGAYISFIEIEDAADAVVKSLDVEPGVYNVAEADPRTRAEHADALAAAVGRDRLRWIPRQLQRLGGGGIESLARSQRISSSALTAASGWKPLSTAISNWESVE